MAVRGKPGDAGWTVGASVRLKLRFAAPEGAIDNVAVYGMPFGRLRAGSEGIP